MCFGEDGVEYLYCLFLGTLVLRYFFWKINQSGKLNISVTIPLPGPRPEDLHAYLSEVVIVILA
jgi:hypothetical protein